MLPLFTFRAIHLALSLVLLAGCAPYNANWNAYSTPFYNGYHDPYSRSDFEELLGFGANLAQTSPASRAETCRTLLKRQKDSSHPPAGIQLHLMVGRLLSEDCGDIPRILNDVASIPAGQLSDDRTRKLVAINTETLKRLNNHSRKVGYTGRKHKTEQTDIEPDANGSKKDENRLLREKLEAIRSMEKQLDQSSGAN